MKHSDPVLRALKAIEAARSAPPRSFRDFRLLVSSMRSLTAALATLALVGCATCERHPAACAAGVAVLATSIALSVDHSSHAYEPAVTARATTQPITCTGCSQ